MVIAWYRSAVASHACPRDRSALNCGSLLHCKRHPACLPSRSGLYARSAPGFIDGACRFTRSPQSSLASASDIVRMHRVYSRRLGFAQGSVLTISPHRPGSTPRRSYAILTHVRSRSHGARVLLCLHLHVRNGISSRTRCCLMPFVFTYSCSCSPIDLPTYCRVFSGSH